MSRLPSIIPTKAIEQMAKDERESRIEQTAVAVLAAMESSGPLPTTCDLFASRLKHAFEVAEAFETERARRREANRGGQKDHAAVIAGVEAELADKKDGIRALNQYLDKREARIAELESDVRNYRGLLHQANALIHREQEAIGSRPICPPNTVIRPGVIPPPPPPPAPEIEDPETCQNRLNRGAW